MKKKRHGGRRPGAGRKLTDPSGAKRPVSVWLSPAERAHCEGIGNGSAGEGLRGLVVASMSRTRR